MKFNSNYLPKTLLLAMSFIAVFCFFIMPSWAYNFPVPIIETSLEINDGAAKKVNAEYKGPVLQYNLTGAAYAGIIDPWQYSYVPKHDSYWDHDDNLLTLPILSDKSTNVYDQLGTNGPCIESTESYLFRNAITGQGYDWDTDTGLIKEVLNKWNGFWIRSTIFSPLQYPTRNYKKFAIAFDYPALPSGKIIPSEETIKITDHWSIISVPLQPTAFKPPTTLIFDQWKNNSTPSDATGNNGSPTEYGRFDPPIPAAFIPGRAFWVTTKNIGDGLTDLTISGAPTTPNHVFYRDDGTQRSQYALKIDADVAGATTSGHPNSRGDYMVGNPWQTDDTGSYTFKFKNIWIEMNGNYDDPNNIPSATKLASYDLDSITTWSINMMLTDTTGSRVDSGNAAGVLETGNDLHSLFNAPDRIAPKEDYIRLSFKNPEDASTPLCYDFRAPGQDKYEWNIELRTSINSIATKLIMGNFKNIPSWYIVTLTDTQSGEVHTLGSDATFDVALTSSTPKTYVLTATRQKPTGVTETAPVALKLKNIYPNPFNPSTTIAFDVNTPGNVSLSIYNTSGQLVETLVNSIMTAGSHQVVWNAAKHSSGVYLVKISSNGFTDTKKVTFMK